MSDSEIAITFQAERDLWYVQRDDATAMVSAEDMVHAFYRWRHSGAPGHWRDYATEFCRQRLESAKVRTRPLADRRLSPDERAHTPRASRPRP